MFSNIKLLDCTLRDGGYVNDWHWGFTSAREIITLLVKANVDIVEVGFLRNISTYDKNKTVCQSIEKLNYLIPSNKGNTMFSAMAMRSNYDVDKLSPYDGKGIEIIRVTAHDYDLEEGLDFAKKVQEKGYKLSINPINIMGYSDEKILWIIEKINEINPWQFAIVDTFGSMKRRDLDRIVSLVDNNLNPNIRLALHLHENMAQSFLLAQIFVDKRLKRSISIDGSLMGMGRIPGNLPIELIADYLNDYANKSYDIEYMMDAVQDHIIKLKGESQWGYTPAYFLSARYNLHRNYAEYYLKKGDLTHRDISNILASIENNKRTVFDKDYADHLYENYKNSFYDDSEDRRKLYEKLNSKEVLLIAPGSSINEYEAEIKKISTSNEIITIGVNFIPEMYRVDYCFFSNHKRYGRIDKFTGNIIITSNLRDDKCDYKISYSSVSQGMDKKYNSLLMLLRLLSSLNVRKIYIAGADGYKGNGKEYYDSAMSSTISSREEYNNYVSKCIATMPCEIEFITPSEYRE